MASDSLPNAARGAIVLALLIAAVSGLSLRSGPIMLAGVWFAAVFALVGILRRRAWSAWGFGGLLLLGIVAILLFAVTGHAPGTIIQTFISIVLYAGVAGIFLVAGFSLAHSGANPGSPLPWVFLAVLLIGPFLYFRPVSVSSRDMENTLLAGDFALVDRFDAVPPAFQEVIAFRYPRDRSQILMRRIIGMGGDQIQLVNGKLTRNGSVVAEPYVTHNSPPAADFGTTVPAGKYFVLGDARDESRDSREWGFVDRRDLIGTPRFIYDSLAPDPSDIKPAPASSGDSEVVEPSHSPVRRWYRLFTSIAFLPETH